MSNPGARTIAHAGDRRTRSAWHALRTFHAPMSIRLAAIAVIPAVLLAAAVAVYGVERVPDAKATVSQGVSAAPSAVGEFAPWQDDPTLPPNHPPIGAVSSPHGALPVAADESPAIVWKMPDGWRQEANPNTMRLATYSAPGQVDVSVSRAGGATEDNIQRWVAQFDGADHQARDEKTVRGLRVVTVDIAGTYIGSGMATAGVAEPKRDWALVGAIVESRSPPYFFKMTGPVAAVRAARLAFDRLLEGIAPR